jgi:hypothetical protein
VEPPALAMDGKQIILLAHFFNLVIFLKKLVRDRNLQNWNHLQVMADDLELIDLL